MPHYRASQAALAALHLSNELALDYIHRFRSTGDSLFTSRSGARLQITVTDGCSAPALRRHHHLLATQTLECWPTLLSSIIISGWDGSSIRAQAAGQPAQSWL
jgi:hypothetical protein